MRCLLKGYENKRPSIVRQAKSHLKHIEVAFGAKALSSVRPSEIRSWTARLKAEGYADPTVYALHARLSHLFSDAVHDGLIPKSPAGRRTSPGAGKARPYMATTDQVWALHDLMPESMRPAVLLAAFAGLRVAEVAALRVQDVDFMRGFINPEIQYPSEPLKTEMSRTPIPIPRELALQLNYNPTKWGSSTIVTGEYGRPVAPYTIETHFRRARAGIEDLPEGFRFHDLRHYFASLLIASVLDVKVVQTRLRHSSAKPLWTPTGTFGRTEMTHHG